MPTNMQTDPMPGNPVYCVLRKSSEQKQYYGIDADEFDEFSALDASEYVSGGNGRSNARRAQQGNGN